MYRRYSAGLSIFVGAIHFFAGSPAFSNQDRCARYLSDQKLPTLSGLLSGYERIIEIALQNRTLEPAQLDQLISKQTPLTLPEGGPSERALLQDALDKLNRKIAEVTDPKLTHPALNAILSRLKEKYITEANRAGAIQEDRNRVRPTVLTLSLTSPKEASLFHYAFSADSNHVLHLPSKVHGGENFWMSKISLETPSPEAGSDGELFPIQNIGEHVAISPDEKYFVSHFSRANNDYDFHVFDTQTATLKFSFSNPNADLDSASRDHRTMAFSRDSRFVAAVTPAQALQIFILDTHNGQKMASILLPHPWWLQGHFAETAIFTPSGKHFIFRLGSGLRVFEVKPGAPMTQERNKILGFRSVGSLHVARTKPFFISSPPRSEAIENSYGPSIKWFNETTEGLKVTKTFDLDDHLGPVTSLDLAADDSFLVTGTEKGIIYLWNTSTGKLIRKIEDNLRFSVIDLKISPDQNYLAVKTLNFAKKNPYQIRLIDLRTDRQVFEFSFSKAFQDNLKWSSDSRHLGVYTGAHDLSVLNLDLL